MRQLPVSLKQVLNNVWRKEEVHHFNVVGILRDEKTGLYRLVRGSNIVTTAGDVHIAQCAVPSPSPTNLWNALASCCLYNYTTSVTPGKSSVFSTTNRLTAAAGKAASAIEANNADTDNTGKGADVITRKFAFTTSEDNGTIVASVIAKASGANSDPLYAAWDWASSFTKASTDTLTVWHNSDITGS